MAGGNCVVAFLLIFIIIDVIQTIYIKHLKKEISIRDNEYENKPVINKKRKQVLKNNKGNILDITKTEI